MQKFIFLFGFNGYGYKWDTRSMDIKMDISQIIKLNDNRIKDITKQMVNQVNSMLMWLYLSIKKSELLYKIKWGYK